MDNQKIQKNFQQKEKLIRWISNNGILNKSLFQLTFPELNYKEIKQKWTNVWNPKIKKGNWTQFEDFQVFVSFLEHPLQWAKIANFLGNRSRIAVRNRFRNSFQSKSLEIPVLKGFLFRKQDIDLGRESFMFFSMYTFFLYELIFLQILSNSKNASKKCSRKGL